MLVCTLAYTYRYPDFNAIASALTVRILHVVLFENEKAIHYTKKRYVFFNFTVS